MEKFWTSLPDSSLPIGQDETTSEWQSSAEGLQKLKKFLHCSEDDLLPGMRPGAPGLKFYQLYAVGWLVRKLHAVKAIQTPQNTSQPPGAGFLIADAPGLGKTLIVLGVLAYFCNWSSNQISKEKLIGITSLDDLSGPVVIACPVSVQTQWQTEAKKWIPAGAWEFLLYPKSLQDMSHWWKNVYHKSNMPVYRRVIIASHSMLTLDYKHRPSLSAMEDTGGSSTHTSLFNVSPWLVVVDEAHMARNTGTQVFKALVTLSQHSICRILLTATPIHNQVENILSLMQLLGLHLSQEESALTKKLRMLLPIFRRKAHEYLHSGVVATTNEDSLQKLSADDSNLTDQIGFGKEFLHQTVAIIKYIMRGHYIRRDYDSVDWEKKPLLELPTKTVIDVDIVLSREEREWYTTERNASKTVLVSKRGGNSKVH